MREYNGRNSLPVESQKTRKVRDYTEKDKERLSIIVSYKDFPHNRLSDSGFVQHHSWKRLRVDQDSQGEMDSPGDTDKILSLAQVSIYLWLSQSSPIDGNIINV